MKTILIIFFLLCTNKCFGENFLNQQEQQTVIAAIKSSQIYELGTRIAKECHKEEYLDLYATSELTEYIESKTHLNYPEFFQLISKELNAYQEVSEQLKNFNCNDNDQVNELLEYYLDTLESAMFALQAGAPLIEKLKAPFKKPEEYLEHYKNKRIEEIKRLVKESNKVLVATLITHTEVPKRFLVKSRFGQFKYWRYYKIESGWNGPEREFIPTDGTLETLQEYNARKPFEVRNKSLLLFMTHNAITETFLLEDVPDIYDVLGSVAWYYRDHQLIQHNKNSKK